MMPLLRISLATRLLIYLFYTTICWIHVGIGALWGSGLRFVYSSETSKGFFFPISIASWVRTAQARKHIPCFSRSWWKIPERTPKCFTRRLTVSWRALALPRAFNASLLSRYLAPPGVLMINGSSPMYPSSASTRSCRGLVGLPWFLGRWWIKAWQNMFMSGQSPHGNGPWTQTMNPVLMQTHISYRKLDDLNLKDLKAATLLPCFVTWQSVQSTVTRQSSPVSSTNWLFQSICMSQIEKWEQDEH